MISTTKDDTYYSYISSVVYSEVCCVANWRMAQKPTILGKTPENL